MASMHEAAAWTASNLGHPPFELSVSLPRILDMRNDKTRGDITTHDQT
jgi:hypothetical protein